MALLLEAVSTSGVVQRTPVQSARTKLIAQQGFTYRLIDDAGANFAQTINVKRDRNALVIDGLPGERVVEISDFFFNCVPSSPCTFVTENIGGAANITPASEPVGALQDGTFMMFTKGELASAVPVAPESEFLPKNILLGVGALALLGAAAGGGGSKSSSSGPDTTAPGTPVLTSKTLTNEARPVLSGTAEANAFVIVSLDIDGNNVADVTYETQANDAGIWQIDTSTATPIALSLPAGGIPDGANVRVIMRARDAANNLSPTASSDVVVVDRLAPSATATLASVRDDQPTLTGELTNGAASNDPTPILSGAISTSLGAGERVQILRNGVVAGEATVSGVTWTFTDNLPAGSTSAVNYSARVADAAGNGGVASTPFLINFDVQAPAVPTIATVGAADVINAALAGAPVLLSGTAEAGARVNVVWGARTFTTIATEAGAWSLSVAPTEIPSNGAQPVAATAVDSAGNESAAASRPVTIATGLPSVPVINAVAGDNRINLAESGGSVTVSGQADSGSTINLNWTGTPGGPRTLTAATNGTWSTVYSATDIAALGQGASSISITSTDAAGNSRSGAPRSIVVDTLAPAAPTIATVAGNDSVSVSERAAGVTVSGTAESGSTVFVIWGSTTLSTTATGGTYSVSFTPAQIPTGSTSTISASVTDLAGNSSAATSRTVALETAPTQTASIATLTDNVAPLTGVVASGASSNDATPTLDGTLSAALPAGGSLRIFRNGTDIGAASVTGTAWTFTESAALVSGTTYAYTARVSDSLGNLGTASVAYSVIFDTTSPTPVIAAVTGDNIISLAEANAGVTVTGTAETGASVRVTWGASVVTVAATAGTYSASFTPAQVPADGTVAVTAVATDAAGNVSSTASQSVVINRTGPAKTANVTTITDDVAPNIGSLTNGASSNDAAPAISGTLTAVLAAGETVHIFRNGTDISGAGITPVGTTWNFTDTSGGMVSGTTYTYSARVLDAALNAGSVGSTFPMVFDNAVAVPVVSVIAGNDIIDAAEKAAGVSVGGTAEAGSAVAVTWGATTLNTTATGGTYSVTFASAQIPADGPSGVSVIATDLAGNVSSAGARSVTISTGGSGFTGGAGADTFSVTPAVVTSLATPTYVLNGAGGVDTLSFSGSTAINLNLTSISNSQVVSFERVDLTGSASNTLTLNASDVLAMGGANLFTGAAWGSIAPTGQVQMVIDGNTGDTLNASSGWLATGGTVTNSGVTYAIYNGSSGATALQLLVDTAISRNIT